MRQYVLAFQDPLRSRRGIRPPSAFYWDWIRAAVSTYIVAKARQCFVHLLQY